MRRTTLLIAGAGVVGALLWVVVGGGSTASAEGRFPDLRVESGAAAERIELAGERSAGPARAALADGAVTRYEYQKAVENALQCLRSDAGAQDIEVSTERPVMSSDGFEYSYAYRVVATEAGFDVADAVSSIEQGCQAAHLIDVQWAYQLGLRADSAYVDGVGRDFEDCVRAGGVEVDVRGRDAVEVAADMSTLEMREEHPRAHACVGAMPSLVTDVRSDPMEHIAR